MENINSFSTYEEALALFQTVDGVGQQNCIFVSLRDVSISPAMVAGGAAGAFLAGVISGIENKSDGFLVNQTEKGIGLIPLFMGKGKMSRRSDKLQADLNNYIFIDQSEIVKVKIKNYAFINTKVKKVLIKTTSGKNFNWIVNVKDKYISYQKNDVSEFIKMYKNN